MSESEFEKYLVRWEGHHGRTWEPQFQIERTDAFKTWSDAMKSYTPEQRGRRGGAYTIKSGKIDSRQCCKDCLSHKSWNERMFIDAEKTGNVSTVKDDLSEVYADAKTVDAIHSKS